MTDTKPSGLLINLALLPFALVGVLILGTCGLCTMVVLSPDTSTQAEPADYLKEHGYK